MTAKRLLDIFGASLGLVILSPALFIVAVLVLHQLGTPVLFRQTRPGKNGKLFEMIKFRTMLDATDQDGNPLSDAARLTPFGKWLRSTSLDELPGLWNVIKGEMSLVGPRPLLVEYLVLYSDDQARRHEVRPGLSGWAQVLGRNAISWEEKFALDVWYVDNRSFWLDIKILMLTILKVWSRDDITSAGGGMMPKFRGSSENTQNDKE